ncbi:MAG: T9SS type A sorting domain-containing protein [Acidobacteriota bacterium]
MVRNVQLYFFSLLLIFSASYAQTPQWTWYFQNNSNVSAMAEDDSSIWFASNFGLMSLNRTSGEKKFFYKLNSGLPANNITDMTIDAKNNKWLAIFGKGLVKYDGQTWAIFNSLNSPLPDNNLWAIASKGDTVWVGGVGSLTSFDGKNWKVYNSSNSAMPSATVVNAIAIDKKGNKWIATDGGGLLRFDGSNWATYTQSNSLLPSNYIKDLAPDDSSRIWIAALGGLLNFDGTKWVRYDLSNSQLNSDVITAVNVDKKGVVWVGTDAMATVSFDGTKWVTYYSSPYEKVNFYTGYYIYVARDNSKWSSGRGGKVARFDDKQWSVYNASSAEMPESPVASMAIDHNNRKWLANLGGLVQLSDTGTVSYTTSNSSIPGDDVHSVAVDQTGKVWMGTNKGLASFNGSSWTVYNSSNSPLYSPDPFSTNVYNVITGKDSTVWVSQNSTKLYSLKGDNWNTFNSSNSTLSTWPVQSIASDSSNTKWISTQYEMLTFSNGNWRKIPFTSKGQLLSMVGNVAFDRTGAAWTGGGSGLVRYNGTDWDIYPFPASVPGTFTSMAFDTSGNAWCAFGGAYIAKYNVKTDKWTSVSPVTLGFSEIGVPGDIYQVVIDKNNTKYFCSTFGVLELQGDIADEVVSSVKSDKIEPNEYRLYQNYPNPFNPSTTIRYSVAKEGYVSLKVYDALGKEVAVLVNDNKASGSYSVAFNAQSLPSGIYFCRIKAGEYKAVKKLLLLK